jgi:hypothetical protein
MRQRRENIEEITSIFLDKMKFCPELVRTERMKIARYHDMLRAEYREFITPSKCNTLGELIDCAREREIELKRQEERGEKRMAERERDSNPSKKARTSDHPKRDSPRGSAPKCKVCSKNHVGECKLMEKPCYNCGKVGHPFYRCPISERVCFNCHETGHVQANCTKARKDEGREAARPNPPKARGRMFQMSAEEARDSPSVVSGIFHVNSIPVYVLFDTGASRSFVSTNMLNHPLFKVEKLEVPIELEVPGGRDFLLFDVCRDCRMTIEEEDFPVELIPMVLGEFSVIIGMDWLS